MQKIVLQKKEEIQNVTIKLPSDIVHRYDQLSNFSNYSRHELMKMAIIHWIENVELEK